jgi:hypothetical protein
MWNDFKRFVHLNANFHNFFVLSNETTEGQEAINYLRDRVPLSFPSYFKFDNNGKWVNIGQPQNRTPAGLTAWFAQRDSSY